MRTGGKPVGLLFLCPCGCNVIGGVSFSADGWSWDGDMSRPSVTPSIVLHTREGPHWHGLLIDGEWRPLECGPQS
ncbi:DUF6527 family protein [Brucella anthropi]|uniref:DUF6527 family protein n=1 Tax=Brucella anthropi TaxID=529 RepID=UPI001CA54362